MLSVSALYYQARRCLFTASENSGQPLNPAVNFPYLSLFYALISIAHYFTGSWVSEKKRERGFLASCPALLFPVNSGVATLLHKVLKADPEQRLTDKLSLWLDSSPPIRPCQTN